MEQPEQERKENAGLGTPVQSNQPAQDATPNVAGKSKKKMSKGKAIAILVILVILWIGAIQIFAADRYEAQVNVIEGSKKVGINPTTENLDFGDLSRETSLTRYISLNNEGKSDKYVIIWKMGEVAEMMRGTKGNFVLKAGQEEKLEFEVYVPPSAETKQYTGRVWIFKYPKWF